MSEAVAENELEQAIAAAELNDEEADLVRGLVGEGMDTTEAIAATLAESRDAEPPEAATTTAAEQPGEPSEKTLKALERELSKHEAAVQRIMGVHVAGFESCRECGGMGITPPGPKPQAHEWFKACDTCDGFGLVLTGSLRDGFNSRDCPACKGRGYLEALDGSGQPLADGGALVPAPAPVAAPIAAGDPPAAPPAPAGEPRFGTPAWMGDVSLGR